MCVHVLCICACVPVCVRVCVPVCACVCLHVRVRLCVAWESTSASATRQQTCVSGWQYARAKPVHSTTVRGSACCVCDSVWVGTPTFSSATTWRASPCFLLTSGGKQRRAGKTSCQTPFPPPENTALLCPPVSSFNLMPAACAWLVFIHVPRETPSGRILAQIPPPFKCQARPNPAQFRLGLAVLGRGSLICQLELKALSLSLSPPLAMAPAIGYQPTARNSYRGRASQE